MYPKGQTNLNCYWKWKSYLAETQKGYDDTGEGAEHTPILDLVLFEFEWSVKRTLCVICKHYILKMRNNSSRLRYKQRIIVLRKTPNILYDEVKNHDFPLCFPLMCDSCYVTL